MKDEAQERQELERSKLEAEKRKIEAEISNLKLTSDSAAVTARKEKERRECAKLEAETEKVKAEKIKLEADKQKLDLEIAALRSISDDAIQQVQKDKLKAEKEKLTGEARVANFLGGFFPIAGSMLSGIVPALAAILAVLVSYLSLQVTSRFTDMQVQKIQADQRIEEDKFFRETILAAADDKAPVYKRIAFIRHLDTFWDAKHAVELANTFASMILNDGSPEILSACSDCLGSFYNLAQLPSDRETLRRILFGTPGTLDGRSGELGVMRRALSLVYNSPEDENVKRANRLAYLLQIVGMNKKHLQRSNFSAIGLIILMVTDADFSGADFTLAQMDGWKLDGSDFSECLFVQSRSQDTSFTAAKFLGAVFRDADLSGSDLFRADFTGATLTKIRLSRTNLKETKGLPADIVDQALTDGAVKMEPTNFALWKVSAQVPLDAGERKQWQIDGFIINGSGQPVLKGNVPVQHGLMKLAP